MKYILVISLILASWAIAEKIDGPSQVVGENPENNIYCGVVHSNRLTTPQITEVQNKMDAALARGDYAMARQYDRQIVDLRYGNSEPIPPAGVPIPHGERASGSSYAPLLWGADKLVYAGALRTYACDYDTNGTMYVAVSASDSTIKIYRSLNHGSTWSFVYSVFHTPRDYYTKLGLVATQGDSGFLHLFCRHSYGNGDIYEFRIKKDFSGYTHYYVATGNDTINDFSVCEDYWNPSYYLYLLYVNEQRSGTNARFVRSLNYGKTFVDSTTWGNGYDPSISIVSNNVLLTTCRVPPGITVPLGRRIYFERNTSFGNPSYWRPVVGVAQDTFNAWQPCVTATNTQPDTAATVWVLYTHDYNNSGDYDADYAYSTNGGATFTTGQHLSWSGDNEDFVNIRHYRIYPNSYVNACYTVYYTTLTRDIYWQWTSGTTPTGWSTEELVNDAPVSTSLGGIIIYSPHSPGSGGGVVYPRWGPDSLFFDANWMGVEEQAPTNQNNNIVTVYPNPFANNITIGYQIANPTKVTLVIYDISGREVKSLVDENANKGYYKITWNGRDNADRFVTNGVYFLKLKTDQENRITKLILTK